MRTTVTRTHPARREEKVRPRGEWRSEGLPRCSRSAALPRRPGGRRPRVEVSDRLPVVSRLLRCGFETVSGVFRLCFKAVSTLFRVCFQPGNVRDGGRLGKRAERGGTRAGTPGAVAAGKRPRGPPARVGREVQLGRAHIFDVFHRVPGGSPPRVKKRRPS